MENYKQISD